MRDALVLWSGEEAAALGQWTSTAADASSVSLSAEPGPRGAALRVDFDLVGPTSWAIARRECSAVLPSHYVAVLRLRGDAPANQLQLKLVDPGGRNVWWWRRPDFAFPREAEALVLRKANLEFAWGPASGGEPERIGAVEIGLAAGPGGSGTLWIEELRIEPRDPAATKPRIEAVAASSFVGSHGPECMLDENASTHWRPDENDTQSWIQLDLGRSCEFGGVVVDVAGAASVPAMRLLASEDAVRWKPLADDRGGAERRRWLRTSDGEGRFARIEFSRGSAPALARVEVVPLELAVSPARYVGAAARKERRGLFPRHLLNEQAYWALVGADGDERKGLLSEDGALEVDAESFSIEPFLWTDGRLVTWANVERRVSLAEGYLPIPSVEWQTADLGLRITAFAAGAPGRSTLVGRYEVENTRAGSRRLRLFLAIRPFQVNPAWQSLNLVGGVAPVTRIERSGGRVRVNDTRTVFSVSHPDAFGAAQSEEGLRELLAGRMPSRERVDDPIAFAEAVLAYDIELAAYAHAGVAVAVRLHDAAPEPASDLSRRQAEEWADTRLVETTTHWRTRLARVPIELPPSAEPFSSSLRASLAWILVNREGPRIQPGPRCYRRSWIRDGTLTGTALAEMGFADEARAFLRWYAPYQLDDGRVPCAVDRNGIDPVAEHDSHGQLIWGIVEVFRLTGDRAFLVELWSHVLRAVAAIAALRAERTADRFGGQACFGLLPESISHEGYSSRPVHSYWDDFFAVRGLADAAYAAAVIGDGDASRRIAALRDAMRRDLHASIVRAIADHGIDFLPGSVELGEFDPTSTAIALDPGGEGARLPPAALARTFERYWEEFDCRRRGETTAEAYTAYEVRNAPALVLLGQKQRAVELLQWLIDDQRPPPWHQWPEVSTRDPRVPRFLGDLPHGWIASSFVRTVRRMFAYERADDGALVLAAGVPAAWVREAPGIRVRALATHAGPLDYSMCAEGEDRVRVLLGGSLRFPSAGIVVESPFAGPLRRVAVDGRERPAADPRRVILRSMAADLILDYRP
ncbi:MAG: discoidin domain-containing protein [Candidatus Binatia bacterium]